MKQNLVGTPIGRMLLGFSSLRALKSIPIQNPEAAGLTGNAILADRLVTQLPASGSVFLDIGAHIGSIFTTVHHHDPSIDIVACEAEPSKAASLKAKFPYARIIDKAVGETPGTAEFFINTAASGYNSLIEQTGSGQTKISVEIVTLDKVLGEVAVDMIKIDIEGAELGALKGGHTMIAAHKPTIMFESTSLDENAMGYSPAKLWSWFADMGYGICTPDRVAHDAPMFTLETFVDAHHYPFRSHNYFAIAHERREEIRDKARRILGV